MQAGPHLFFLSSTLPRRPADENFYSQLTNVLNHFQPVNPALNIDSPGNFGVINGQSNTPRQMEFGIRLFF